MDLNLPLALLILPLAIAILRWRTAAHVSRSAENLKIVTTDLKELVKKLKGEAE